jgi:RNA polymerase sigma-70 factor (ECF subfamily)
VPPPSPDATPGDLEARFGDWIRVKVRRFFPADFEDVAQDVMLRLVQALPAMRDGSDPAMRAFVGRTVRSVCIDEWRRRAIRPRGEDVSRLELPDPRAAAPAESAMRAESSHGVAAAWAGLPERERAILQLRFRDGLSFREIAEVLAVPQGSVAGWYSRALAALREKLT